MKCLRFLSVSVAVFWTAAIFLWSGMTANKLRRAHKTRALCKAIVSGQANAVRADLLDVCWLKGKLVAINGFWARLLGQRLCNKVLKLKNGYLLNVVPNMKLDPAVPASMENLSAFCSRRGTRTLFVMFPDKMDVRGALMPRGAPDYSAQKMADDFLGALRRTRYVDTRPALAAMPENVAENFLKTDHHWNFLGALRASGIIARAICESLRVQPGELPQLDPANWEARSLGRAFMGTSARRTGPYFGGLDEDVTYFVPAFETEIRRRIPAIGLDVKGAFEKSMIDEVCKRRPKDMYMDPGYSIYGADRPLTRTTNLNAPIRKRVLIVKDSFALPVAAFLSTVFTEITVLDLRHYRDMTLAEHVRRFRPNIVCVMYNPGALSQRRFFQFGDCAAPRRRRRSR